MKKLKGYKKHIRISTDLKSIEKINEPLDLIKEHFKSQDGYVDVWQHNAHFFGTIKNGNVIFSSMDELQTEKLQELRAFNLTQELRIWRTNNVLKGRLRIDYDRTEGRQDIIEVDSVLVKTKKIPADSISKPSLRARYYIDYTENGLATIGDYRFVDFVEFS